MTADLSQDDSRLAEAVEQYLAELESGNEPSLPSFLAQYEDLGAELEKCLEGLRLVHRVSPQLSSDGAARSDDVGVPSTPAGTLGDFRILREIARGGMGVVFEAEQISLPRRVAVKVLPFASVLDQRQLARFKNEARAAATLDHPGIVSVYSVGCDRGVHYYAMQFVEGQSLAELIAELQCKAAGGAVESGESVTRASEVESTGRNSSAVETSQFVTTGGGRTDFQFVARLGVQAAEALDDAHQHGIVHRDVKPANLLLDIGGNVHIADFGLARFEADAGMTMTGDVLGTLRYMSPEQALAKRAVVDHRTDIYSLGVTLYELLTLQPAFSAKDRRELHQNIAFDEPTRPRRINRAIPVDLETILLKSISKSAEDRYPTAQALADDLQRFLQRRPVQAKRVGSPTRSWRWCQRNPIVAALLLLVGLTLAAGTTVSSLFALRAQREATVANVRQEQSERMMYALQLNQVQHLLEHSRTKAAQLLNDPVRCPDALRDFTWGHLLHLSQVGSRTIRGPGSAIHAVCYSKDGQTLIVGDSAGAISFCDARTGAEQRSIPAHDGAVWALAIAPDGQTLASVGRDRVVRLWDAKTGRETTNLPTDRPFIYDLTFGPDGRFLVGTGGGQPPALWGHSSWILDGVLSSPSGEKNDLFGASMAVSGETLLVGSQGDRIGGESRGSVYCFRLSEDNWVQSHRLLAPTQGAPSRKGDRLGKSVSIDGDFAVCGAPGAHDATGVAHIFRRNDGGTPEDANDDAWLFMQTITGADSAAGDRFGIAVAIRDGTIVAGSVNDDDHGNDAGAAYVFVLREGNWVQQQKLMGAGIVAGHHFGHSVSLSSSAVVIGAPKPTGWGSVYVFGRDTSGMWTQTQQLTSKFFDAEDTFGHAVAIDDDTIVAGAPRHNGRKGAATIFCHDNGQWLETQSLEAIDRYPDDRFGTSVAIRGDIIVVGARSANGPTGGAHGAVYVFAPEGAKWTERQKLTTDQRVKFGDSVALGDDRLIVGALNSKQRAEGKGVAHVFRRCQSGWQRRSPPNTFAHALDGLAFAPDRSLIAVDGNDSWLHLVSGYGPVPGRQLAQVRLADQLTALAICPLSQLVAAGCFDGSLVIHDRRTKKDHSVFQAHSGPVSDLAFSPDGNRLVSTGRDATLKLWDLATVGQTRAWTQPLVLTGHSGPIESVTFSPDGDHVATAALDGTLKIWDVRHARDQRVLRGHTEQVVGVAASQDGQLLASGSKDGTVRLWNRTTGAEIATFQGHADAVWDVAFSPDGRQLASASRDGTLRLWDLATGSQLGALNAHEGWVFAVSFSPDGATLASAGKDGSVKLWDPRSQSLKRSLDGHTDRVWSVAFAPDGKVLATASRDRTVILWNTDTGAQIGTLNGHSDGVYAVSFSPDGRTLASSGVEADQSVRLWDLQRQELRGTLLGHTGAVYSVAFSPDGKTLATGSFDKTIRFWDPVTGVHRGTLAAHEAPVHSIAFCADNRTLVSGSADRTIKLWEAFGGENRPLPVVRPPALAERGAKASVTGSAGITIDLRNEVDDDHYATPLLGHDRFVSSLAFSPDGRVLASTGKESLIRLWDVSQRRLLDEVPRSGDLAADLDISVNGEFLAATSSAENSDDKVQVWSLRSRQLVNTFHHQPTVTDIAFHPTRNELLTGGKAPLVGLWRMPGRRESGWISRLCDDSRFIGITALAISRDGSQLATASDSRHLQLWNLETGKLIRSGYPHGGRITSLTFSAGDKVLVSSTRDIRQSILFWDVESAERIAVLHGHVDTVNSVVLSSDSRLLASASSDGTIKLWDVATAELHATLRGHSSGVHCLEFSPDNRILASGGADQKILLWNMEAVAARCALVSSINPATNVCTIGKSTALASENK